MEIKQEIVYDHGTANYCFSIRKQKYMEIDGARQDIGQPERLVVRPGDFEQVEAFAPELLPIMKRFWTDEVIAAYKEKVEAAEAIPETQAQA